MRKKSDPGSASINAVAAAMNLSTRRVRELAAEGVIPRPVAGQLPVLLSLTSYVRYLQQRTENSLRLSEDARLRAAQAALREHDFAEARAKVLDSALATRVLAGVRRLVTRRVRAIGRRLAPALDRQSADRAKRIVDAEAITVLTDVCAGLVELEERFCGQPKPRSKKSKP